MIRVRLRLYWSPRCYPITPSCSQNVQAFIRRAPRMADKTSWTKPRARMTYGDSIVEAGGLTAGIGTAAGPWPARLRADDGGTTGNTMPPCVGIGERAADILQKEYAL